MNTLQNLHTKEPVVTWGTAAAVFNALQLLALPGLPIWVHTVILIAATVASVIAARSNTVSINDKESVKSVARDLGVIEKVVKDV